MLVKVSLTQAAEMPTTSKYAVPPVPVVTTGVVEGVLPFTDIGMATQVPELCGVGTTPWGSGT